MSVEFSILLIFSPLLLFTACAVVVTVAEWWDNRGKVKR